MKNFFLGELLGLLIAAIAWVLMWALDFGSNTLELLNHDFSVRIIVALLLGLITSLTVSAIRKRTRQTEEIT